MVHLPSKKQFKLLTTNYLKKSNPFLLFLFLVGVLLNLFFSNSAFCQPDTVSPSDSIELQVPILLDSTLLRKKIKTDFSIGFRGGITNGRFLIANPEQSDQNSSSAGSVLSVFVHYNINPRFSIQPELAMGRYRSNNTTYTLALLEGTIDYVVSTLDFNLMGIYTYPINDMFSLSAEAGFSAASLYRSFGKVIAPNSRGLVRYDIDAKSQFEKLNYGAIVGICPSLNLKNVNIQASIRYRYGLNNINAFDYSLNRYLSNPERTIKTRDILFQVGFFIPIYKSAAIK